MTTRPAELIAEAVTRGVRALSHRGPDDQGIEIFRDESRGLTVALGQTRLSILDLSAAGHQPMRDERTGDLIVYNGEVFNFADQRRVMEAGGTLFRSGTDTEVVLKRFGRDGRRAIEGWRGMFAFGYWHRREGRLSLVRDRLGIKPLYYHRGQDFLIFGSEVRSLLATGLVPRSLSEAAVESYLAYGSIEAPLTIVEDVYSLLPGHLLEFQDGKIRTIPYWEIEARGSGGLPVQSDSELVEEIGELAREAVRLRTIADVPVSVFLSGGIDSSAIVSLMRRATQKDIRTFSVNFREEGFDEQHYAEAVARRYGTEHTSVLLTRDEIPGRLPAAIRAMDQPSIDGINTWIVSEATAMAGLKVAISGLGGDEAFLGYRFFQSIERDERWRRLLNLMPESSLNLAAMMLRATTSGTRSAKLGALLRSGRMLEHSVKLYRQLFPASQRRELLGCGDVVSANLAQDRELLAAWSARQMERCREADPINQASVLDLGGYLANTLLRDTDVMSMAHGLEVRVPLLDHRLIERLLSIPGPAKLGRREPKWLLVRAAGDLPREVIERPKRGFELPFSLWLRGTLREEVEQALANPRLLGIVRREAVEGVWRGFLAGRSTWSRVWALFVLSRWIDIHIDNGGSGNEQP